MTNLFFVKSKNIFLSDICKLLKIKNKLKKKIKINDIKTLMLGFSKNAIEKIIDKELQEDAIEVEELVKRVLKKM